MRTSRATSRRGITTVELLIALIITAITGLAIATVTTSLARGVSGANETRGALQRALTAHARFRVYLEPALCVLDHDPAQGFALWLHDDRSNGQVNVSELRVFWYDGSPDGDVVMERVEFPDAWTDQQIAAADLTLSPVDDFFDAMETQRSLGYTQTVTMVDGVSGQDVLHTGPTLPQSDRVRVALDLHMGDLGTERMLIVAGLAGHRTPI